MAYSMTAFARVEADGEWGRAAWELRSVNHRYAEVGVRLPEDMRVLEARVRERIAAVVKRGKIDCALRLETASAGFHDVAINEQAAAAVLDAAGRIAALSDNPAPVNPLDVLRWPGVTETAEIDRDQVQAAVLDALDAALDSFLDMRRREGDQLAALINQRLDGIDAQLDVLEVRVPEIVDSVRDRHFQRVREIADGLDEGRVEQDMRVAQAAVEAPLRGDMPA
ncbi:MAG: YicC/YloC family endoribonuclease, partial [Gammaproteobacteria bacterium]